jgi:hypothetical protein
MACKFGSDSVAWFKSPTYEDNWEHCPVRVDTAKEHFVNSWCLYDYDRHSGHNEAKWREASALIGLTEAETEAVIAMQFHESESDESSDDEELREQQEYQTFVAANPYPSYGEMTRKMMEFVQDRSRDSEFRSHVFTWMSEYGEPNHRMCQELYEHIHDDARCKAVGQRIYDRGGMTALQANFYIVRNFAPSAQARHDIRAASGLLNYHFNGVGEWNH